MRVALIATGTAAAAFSVASASSGSQGSAAAFVGAPGARLGAARAFRSGSSTSSVQMKLWDFGGKREVRYIVMQLFRDEWGRFESPSYWMRRVREP